MTSTETDNGTKNVRDGVVNPALYFNVEETPVRILFLLKEANDPEGGGWDLCNYLREGGRWQTWNNVTRWALALGAVGAANKSVEGIDEHLRREVLSHIAAINLKKAPGRSTAYSQQIRDAAAENSEIIRAQIVECDPDIIICCGSVVADCLDEMFSEEKLFRGRKGGRRYGTIGRSIALDFWHPAARKGKAEMVNEITSLYQAALREA